MNFLWPVKVCTRLDRLCNEDVPRKLNIFELENRITENKLRLQADLEKMPDGVYTMKFGGTSRLSKRYRETQEMMVVVEMELFKIGENLKRL